MRRWERNESENINWMGMLARAPVSTVILVSFHLFIVMRANPDNLIL